ncbi:hypothetical protein Tco_0327438 [Tanacetum coccineum]
MPLHNAIMEGVAKMSTMLATGVITGTEYDNQRAVNVAGARENVGIGSTLYVMTQIHEVTPDSVDNSGPIFDDEPMHKIRSCRMTGCETDNLDQERDLLAS